ncbi:hypothetical protein [Loktanella sp. S4079]|uniref:hypothetical protein n=1 Tax=Loktanella sp. S4079 TaxID=579483 RepID=UPI0005F9E150|nr:hypothetical protein [Loktanella sp. S4079]KJZ18548.1 hypothetical protein TW80_14090 [Loktanella sp. S4079]
MLNANDPFYRPIWRRAVIVALCLGWGLFEALSGSPGFAVIFLALGVYATVRLFVTYSPETPSEED